MFQGNLFFRNLLNITVSCLLFFEEAVSKSITLLSASLGGDFR